MNRDPQNLSCTEFQSLLPELIGSGQNVSQHPHVRSCDLCRTLLSDLETIAEAARQLLASVEPPDNLWRQIESAIQKEENESTVQ